MGLPHPCLILITAPSSNLAPIVQDAIAGGVGVVLWRDGRVKIGKRDPALTAVASATSERAMLVAEGDWETFARLGLRRVHLPERSAPIGVVRFRIGSGALIGKSVGSVGAALRAEADGADYIMVEAGLGSDGEEEMGGGRLGLLREISAAVKVSVVVSGDVRPSGIGECIAAGAVGVAVSSPIMQAADPQSAARQYRIALEAAWEGDDAAGPAAPSGFERSRVAQSPPPPSPPPSPPPPSPPNPPSPP